MFRFYKGSEDTILSKSDGFTTNLRLIVIALLLNAGVGLAQPPETIQKTKNVRVSPEQLSASFAEVAKQVQLAVVNIDTKGRIRDITFKGDGSDENSDLRDLLRRRNPPRASYAVGSGFIVDKSGYILTNYHVVEDSSRITVRLQTGDEFTAKIIGADEETDLAVLKIEAGKDLPFLNFGDSKSIRIGDWVLAIGSPFGLARTVTAGIISQTKRETPYATSFQQFIQTDAAINRGNSGGPLVNMKGEVIGVNSQIATSTGDYNGIGFALPSNEAAYVYRQILQNGRVRRGYLGVLLDSVKKEFAQVYRLEKAKGAIITDVRDTQGSAAKAGIKKDDIIIELNGVEIEDRQDLIEKIASTLPGQDVRIALLREAGENLERIDVTVRLGERPSNDFVGDDNSRRKLPIDGMEANVPPFGLTLAELNSRLIRDNRLGKNKGLLVLKVDPASFIADVKDSNGETAFSKGVLIQRINRVSVTNIKDFNKIVRGLHKGSPVVLHILKRRGLRRRRIPMIVQFTVN